MTDADLKAFAAQHRFLDNFNDRLIYLWEVRILQGGTIDESTKEFLKWAIQENEDAMTAKRGPDGISFADAAKMVREGHEKSS